MVLGLYYMSLVFDGELGEGSIFVDVEEVEHALNRKSVSLHAKVKCRRHKSFV